MKKHLLQTTNQTDLVDHARRKLLLASAAGLSVSGFPAFAQGYPNKPIRWIVPYAAGGTTDQVARLAGEALGNVLGQRVMIDNKPGAASTLGIGQLATSAADGYTLATADNAALFNNWHLFDKLPYGPDSFEYVAPLMQAPLVLVVGPAVPAGTFQEWVAWAKQNAGKASYGTPGIGSPHHIAMALLNDRLGLGLQHVPYRGDSAAVVDVISGVLPCMLLGVATARQYAKEGKLRLIALNWPSRLASMPDVPTLAEVGVKNFEASAEQAVLAPAGTPKEIVNRLNREILTVMNTPAIKDRLEVLGIFPPVSRTPEELKSYVRRQAVAAGVVIKKNGITMN
jgi:tripartite-type tricarboxylate transporter receptor subunit TctC